MTIVLKSDLPTKRRLHWFFEIWHGETVIYASHVPYACPDSCERTARRVARMIQHVHFCKN